MANVKFITGDEDQYDALGPAADDTTFYRVTSWEDGSLKHLYLGTLKLSNGEDVDALNDAVGTLSNLDTTDQSSLVNAINEVYTVANAGGTGSVVTITEDTTSSDYAKVYTVKQGETEVGTINIPKDMVVSSGEIVVDPEGLDAGTYIALTLSNADGTIIYINVEDLVDAYTAGENATQVQLAISGTNEITATLVAGAVGTTELADNAVTTAKVTDGSITIAKLEAGVQTSLGLADTAVQSVTTGTANGTISVDGTDVSVYGLGSAAYTESTDYDASGAAAAVLGTSEDTADDYTVYGVRAYAENLLTWETLE